MVEEVYIGLITMYLRIHVRVGSPLVREESRVIDQSRLSTAENTISRVLSRSQAGNLVFNAA